MMRAYLLAISGIAVLSSVISMLLPGKRFKSITEGILKLCILAVILAPIVRSIEGEYDIFHTNNTEITSDYLQKGVILSVKQYIKNEFGLEANIICEGYADITGTNKKMEIIIVNSGMIEEAEHIHIKTEIREQLQKRKIADIVTVKFATEDSHEENRFEKQ